MFDESHRGHLRFWFSDEVVVVGVEVVVVLEEEEDCIVCSRAPPPSTPVLMEEELFEFLSFGVTVAVAPPNSSWIIFYDLLPLYVCGSTRIQKQ